MFSVLGVVQLHSHILITKHILEFIGIPHQKINISLWLNAEQGEQTPPDKP